jgi:regulator of nonsense transcripts 2
VELPSDSTFAVALRNQQQAEKEEQQRIKNLVLNYDLRENEDHDGDSHLQPLFPNANIHKSSKPGHEKPASYHHNRMERHGKDRGGQRVRKLQLSDVDWYDNLSKGMTLGGGINPCRRDAV